MKITENTKLGEIYNIDEFKDVRKYFLGNQEELFQQRCDVSLQYINGTENVGYAKDIAYGLNRLYEIVKEGKEFLFPVYSKEEIDKEPEKEVVQLVYFPAENSKRFVILLAGGAYARVCSMKEAFPVATKLNELGITVFCLNYRVDQVGLLPKPLDDLAAAYRFIEKNSHKFGIEPTQYAVGGFSAGGHATSMWGTKEKGYEFYGLPKPQMLMLGYPYINSEKMEALLPPNACEPFFISMFGNGYTEEDKKQYNPNLHIDCDYPPVYATHAQDDDLVSIDTTVCMTKVLEEAGVAYKLELPITGGHGFGLGSGTSSKGWINRAVDFWNNETSC